MPKPNVIVDRVRSLDLPNRPLVAAQGTGIPGHAIVHLTGGASLLDLSDPRAAIWEGILDDLRQAPAPFAARPAMMVMPAAGPLGNVPLSAAGVTPQQAQQLFALVASQSYIPFKYPDNGCWGRAHEMCRLIIASAVQPRKVWI